MGDYNAIMEKKIPKFFSAILIFFCIFFITIGGFVLDKFVIDSVLKLENFQEEISIFFGFVLSIFIFEVFISIVVVVFSLIKSIMDKKFSIKAEYLYYILKRLYF